MTGHEVTLRQGCKWAKLSVFIYSPFLRRLFSVSVFLSSSLKSCQPTSTPNAREWEGSVLQR